MVAFLFSEIRYKLNRIEITRVKNLGVISFIKNILSLRDSHRKAVKNVSWVFGNDNIFLESVVSVYRWRFS